MLEFTRPSGAKMTANICYKSGQLYLNVPQFNEMAKTNHRTRTYAINNLINIGMHV